MSSSLSLRLENLNRFLESGAKISGEDVFEFMKEITASLPWLVSITTAAMNRHRTIVEAVTQREHSEAGTQLYTAITDAIEGCRKDN